MGRIGNVSGDLPGKTGGRRVRAARLSKKDSGNESKRSAVGSRTSRPAKTKPAVAEEPLVIESFDSVWEALGFSPQECVSLEARSLLMMQIAQIIEENKWTQAQAAKQCGVSQPRMNDLIRGKIDKFSIDALVDMATALGRRLDYELKAA